MTTDRFRLHPSSYRDPSGFVFFHNDHLYRQVNTVFKEDFDLFIHSGLYGQLVQKSLLIPHKEIADNLTGNPEWYLTLQPEPLQFVSYAYEWSFDMLKDAALLTLDIARQAMSSGLMLKDASSYNVQLHKGKMIFIDTLSFERYDESKAWIAYRQFCEHFFAPLALMHYLKTPLQTLLMANPDGIPLTLAKKLLPFRSKWNLHSYLHLHLHSAVKKTDKASEAAKPFSRQKLTNLFRSLEDGIRAFSFSQPSGVWSGYYDEANRREDYITAKKQIISQWADRLEVKTVLDAGANEGAFTDLWTGKAEHIISADFDHFAVNRLYQKIRERQITNIHPMIMDLANPSPALGVNNQERLSFSQRAKSDLAMALALIHHLSIGKNIPFKKLAAFFHPLCRHLIIEFVPKEDPKIQLMLSQKKDVYNWYAEQQFLEAFSSYFVIADQASIASSGRVLYLMQAK